MIAYQQATTGKLHARRSCSIDRRTRYDHFPIDLATKTPEEIARYPKCSKCWPTTSAATQTNHDAEEATQMARTTTKTTKTAPATQTEEQILESAAQAAPAIEQAAQEIAKESAARRAAKPKPASEPAPDVDLTKEIVRLLKDEGIGATTQAAKNGKSYRVLVGKASIAVVYLRSKGAQRVRPRLVAGDLPKSVKGFKPLADSASGYAVGATFKPGDDLSPAIAALKLAHEKASAGKGA